MKSVLTSEQLTRIKSLRGNDRCCDCGERFPQWVSLTYGTLICLKCSGLHRSLGVHISFVRSLDLDAWTKEQLDRVIASGGNEAFAKFLAENGVEKQGTDRYITTAAYLYKYRLDCLDSGNDPPSVLPPEEALKCQQFQQAYCSQMQAREAEPDWFPDSGSTACTICSKKFTIFFRRHHCRNCGALVCRLCAPIQNSKPIPRLQMQKPVRHCRVCYQSPLLKWKPL